jgi:hypothetical protein
MDRARRAVLARYNSGAAYAQRLRATDGRRRGKPWPPLWNIHAAPVGRL